MAKSNTDIVREQVEALNRNDFAHLLEICSPDCVSHASPYVGLGVLSDDSSGNHIVVTAIAPAAPADGILEKGDELLKVMDGERTWETLPKLQHALWGQGIPGTPLTVTVQRRG